MEHFTPWSALAGGSLIGASASLLLLLNGRIAGISGIVGGLVHPRAGDVAWRLYFLAGLLVGGLVLLASRPSAFGAPVVSLPLTLVAGLLVGFGTRLGSGCTSGHGVCGVSRLSLRSIVATAIFVATGMLATFLVQHVIGGAP
jgi:uncharacterized membrane protein YedE/YeeE